MGTAIGREYDSDGEEEVPPRVRQELRGQSRSWAPVCLLPKDIQEEHISAMEEAVPGEVDRRAIELEQDYATIVRTQPMVNINEARVPPCDRCKVSLMIPSVRPLLSLAFARPRTTSVY
jgi:hypothetical protein